MELLSIAHSKMERIMLSIALCDHTPNTWIRHQTYVNDIIYRRYQEGNTWMGGTHQLQYSKTNRWTITVTEWTPRGWQGRPKARWGDNIIHHLCPAWPNYSQRSLSVETVLGGFFHTEPVLYCLLPDSVLPVYVQVIYSTAWLVSLVALSWTPSGDTWG